MNIYEKLQEARCELQSKNLKKSGKNKFANYDYYELKDFLPTINEIFKNKKLCSAITFDNELATLIIINSETPEESMIFTSPMRDLDMKGTNAVQALGGVETYQRRYLYMTALEIVESDAFDSGVTEEKIEPKLDPAKKKNDELISGEQFKELINIVGDSEENKQDASLLIGNYGYKNAKYIKAKDYEEIKAKLVDILSHKKAS